MSLSENQAKQIATSHLLLKADHWIPVSLDLNLTAEHRSSSQGPVITAHLIADVDGVRIVGWKKPQFEIRQVRPDGSLAPYDLESVVRVLDAFNQDNEAEAAGAIGINRAILAKEDDREFEKLSAELREAAFQRARLQILDRLYGFRAAGVRLHE